MLQFNVKNLFSFDTICSDIKSDCFCSVDSDMTGFSLYLLWQSGFKSDIGFFFVYNEERNNAEDSIIRVWSTRLCRLQYSARKWTAVVNEGAAVDAWQSDFSFPQMISCIVSAKFLKSTFQLHRGSYTHTSDSDHRSKEITVEMCSKSENKFRASWVSVEHVCEVLFSYKSLVHTQFSFFQYLNMWYLQISLRIVL